jgi:hypothetical protein
MGLSISPPSTAPFANGSMTTIVCALIGPWTAEPRQKRLKAVIQSCPQPLNNLTCSGPEDGFARFIRTVYNVSGQRVWC